MALWPESEAEMMTTIVQKYLQAITKALTGKEIASIGELLDKIELLQNSATAAPALLEACKHTKDELIGQFDCGLLQNSDEPRYWQQLIGVLEAAIAKAEKGGKNGT